MKKRMFKFLDRIEKHWVGPLLGLLCLSTLLWIYQLNHEQKVNILPAIANGAFYSLQFIVLNKELNTEIKGGMLFGLTFVQFALPLFASAVLLGGIFREQIRPVWIRRYAIGNLKAHHIVLGYGDLGKALASKLNNAMQHVVAIDLRESDRQEGELLFLLKGDARSPIEQLFAGCQLQKASCLYLLLPDENENLRLLGRLNEFFETKQPAESLRIYLRTETHALGQVFTDWVGLAATHGQACFDIRPVNPYDIVARDVVNTYSPDCYVPTDQNGPIAQTIMIVGTSRMAQSLLLRFARIGIYAPHGKLRILWVGDDVSTEAESLIADNPFLDAQRYPQVFWGADATTNPRFYKLNLPSVDLIPLQGRAESLMRSGTVLEQCEGQLPAAIYVCHDSDVRNIKEARDLQSVLGADFPPTTQPRRLILALQNQTTFKLRDETQWMRYEIKEESIDQNFASTLVCDKADCLAERFKNAYDLNTGKTLRAWKSVSYFEKESNRDAADHGAIKTRYAGLDSERVKKVIFEGIGEMPEAGTRMEAEKEALYLMEQRRYRAFMFMMGFRHVASSTVPEQLPKGKKDDWMRTQRINATLLQEKLSDFEKAKDTNIVRITAQAFNGRFVPEDESPAVPHPNLDHHVASAQHHTST